MATLTLLGTGTPTPTPSQFGTSYVLNIGNDYLMFDCGPATTHKLVKAGLFPTQIDFLFFTHHHFDHNADYPCFLLCRWDQSRGQQNELRVFGPEPTRRMTEQLIGPDGAFACDWKARVGAPVSQCVHANRGGSLPRPEPSLTVKDIGPGEVTRHADWSVRAAAAQHVEPWLISLAYRVDAKDGSICFAGDTAPCDPVAELAKGADVLVVNCWDTQAAMDANGEAPGQTGTTGAATMAREAGVGKLILTHTGPRLNRPGGREGAVAEIARGFNGEIVFGQELMTLPL
ncbi:MAG: MBL fold metallo-hydrolase [Planctomycetota bacterium]